MYRTEWNTHALIPMLLVSPIFGNNRGSNRMPNTKLTKWNRQAIISANDAWFNHACMRHWATIEHAFFKSSKVSNIEYCNIDEVQIRVWSSISQSRTQFDWMLALLSDSFLIRRCIM